MHATKTKNRSCGSEEQAPLVTRSQAVWTEIVNTTMRRLFSHLTIDQALPELCRWPVGCILLTEIGHSFQ
jgi:hypothetical protein